MTLQRRHRDRKPGGRHDRRADESGLGARRDRERESTSAKICTPPADLVAPPTTTRLVGVAPVAAAIASHIARVPNATPSSMPRNMCPWELTEAEPPDRAPDG